VLLKRLKVLDLYIATLTKRPAPLYTVGRLQVRTAEESGAIIDGKPPLQPTTVVPVAARKDINPQPEAVAWDSSSCQVPADEPDLAGMTWLPALPKFQPMSLI
jgi:hypothetical protein